MKIKLKGEAKTRKVWLNGKLLSPVRSQKMHNHSPDGFNWGYGGSGPAQLALAICLELFCPPAKQKDSNIPLVEFDYQWFKWKYIGALPIMSDFDVEIDVQPNSQV